MTERLDAQSPADKEQRAAALADEIEPQIGTITHVSLSYEERELIVEALRALSARSAGTRIPDERLREIAKKHARDSLGHRWAPGEGRNYTGAVDAVYLQNLVRAEEIIFYAMKEAETLHSARTSTTEREAKLRDFVLGIADGFLACQSAVTPETAKAMREEGERIYKFVAALSPINPADRRATDAG